MPRSAPTLAPGILTVWLLPVLSGLSRLSARTFYRVRVTGAAVPASGPVVLVANHPNSLVDPVLLAAAAGRPIRFLAKAPLFDHPAVGFLVRGAGAIPVYRKVDDPGAMDRNEDMFRAAHQALADGSAVALFPEGVSHSEPSLMPLKTGAARLALGAREAGVPPFPIIPVGIVLRRRETFRSPALVVVGPPVPWEDLATQQGGESREAVRQLTDRIESALQAVTVNLERWEDQPLVETADAVWSAQADAGGPGPDQVARLRVITTVLRHLRTEGGTSWQSLARRLAEHRRRLRVLGLTPAALAGDIGPGQAVRWTVTRVPLLVAALVMAAGSVLFWPPYRLVGWAVDRQHLDTDVRATHKLLLGAVLMPAWIVLVSVACGVAFGWMVGAGALVGLPLLGWATLRFRDWIGDSWRAARRYLLMRTRAELRNELRAEQVRLAGELEAINRHRADGRDPDG